MKIFQQSPIAHRLTLLKSQKDEDFVVTRPPAAWMLISFMVHKIVRHLIPNASKIRADLKKNLKGKGDTPTLAIVNEKIMEDDNLRISYALSMVPYILTELTGYIIARSLDDAWLKPGPARKLLNLGILENFYKTYLLPESLEANSILQLCKEQTSSDPILLALRFSAYGIEKTLSDPVERRAFIRSERKSRYLQSDALLKKYPQTIDSYESYFAQPANFTEWWDKGSIYGHIKDLLC